MTPPSELSYCEREAQGFPRHPTYCREQCSLCSHIAAAGHRLVLSDWQLEDVLAILDGSGITITDDKLLTRTLHKHGLMRTTPVDPR